MKRSGSPLGELILFARRPLPGRTKTRLIPMLGKAEAAGIAEAFVNDALAKTRKVAGWRTVVALAGSDGDLGRRWARSLGVEVRTQSNGNLGARMRRALADSSASCAAIVGTDVPSLPRRILKRNLKLLGRNDVVLGPALDGGYYF